VSPETWSQDELAFWILAMSSETCQNCVVSEYIQSHKARDFRSSSDTKFQKYWWGRVFKDSGFSFSSLLYSGTLNFTHWTSPSHVCFSNAKQRNMKIKVLKSISIC